MARRSLSVAFVLAAPVVGQDPAAVQSVDALVEALVTEDRAVDAQVELLRRGEGPAEALGRAVLHGWPGNPRDTIARAAAARVLIELGARGVPAFDDLEECLRDPYVPGEAVVAAMQALVVITPFAGEKGRALADRLTENPRRTGSGYRREVFGHWLQLVSSAEVDAAGATVDELLATFASSNPYAIATACRALTARCDELGRTGRILRALQGVVDEEFERNSRWSWSIAGRSCSWPLDDATVRWLRTQASLAICAHAPDDDHALLGRSQQLFDLDPEVRIAAARWLGQKRRPDAGRWLLDAARAGTPETALAALAAIQRIGPTLRHLGPDLKELAETAREPVAAAAQSTLRVLAPDVEDVPPIRSVLEIVGSGLPDGSSIRLAAERRRLQEWLDRDGWRNRHLLQDDARHIDAFHALSTDDGGPGDRNVRWIPVRIPPDEWRPGHWEPSLAEELGDVVDAAPPGAVGPRRERLRPLPWIVELVPTDRRETAFTREDCERLVPQTWSHGRSFAFLLRAEHAAEMTGLKTRLFRRGGSLLHVVDGLAVWVRPITENEGFNHPGGGFAIRPGSEDRSRALLRMLDR